MATRTSAMNRSTAAAANVDADRIVDPLARLVFRVHLDRVALWEPEDRGCLLGARIGGEVIVGRPGRVQLQPGEAGCDAQAALALPRLRPPH
jgi:hypothetical protein